LAFAINLSFPVKEDLRQLQTLLDKIQSTWELLGVDVMSDEKNKLEQEMQAPQFWSDAERAKNISKRHESLKGEVETWTKLKEETKGLIALFQELGETPDEAMEKEIIRDKEILEKKFAQLEFYVLFSGKHDKKNAIVSIHAGSGGTEAQDWSGMLMRMLFRFAEKKGWSTTLLDETRGAEAGIKSCTFCAMGSTAMRSGRVVAAVIGWKASSSSWVCAGSRMPRILSLSAIETCWMDSSTAEETTSRVPR
jgi:peptide chain release factor 2